jgi:hypothetical protein
VQAGYKKHQAHQCNADTLKNAQGAWLNPQHALRVPGVTQQRGTGEEA